MISYWLKKVGDSTMLERREVPMPQLVGNEMRVRMRASSFNRGDMMARIRRHSADKPRPAGVDGAGEVVEPGLSGLGIGDRVMFRGHNCYSEYCAVDPGLAIHIPEGMPFERAAAIPGGFVTAWEALIRCGSAAKGDTVMLCGASSSVGVAALQVAKHMGMAVIAVSGSAQKLSVLKSLGADAIVQARASTFTQEVLRLTDGKGVDVSLNMVGASAFSGCVEVAANFGRVVVVGYIDGQPMRAECDLEAVHGRRLIIAGTSNAPLTPALRAEAQRGLVRDVFPALASCAILPVIDRVFDFEDLPAAKAYFESDRQIGKVIVRMH